MARGEPMSMSAGAATRKKVPKEIDHLRVREGEDGGHIIEHHHTHFDHPEEHFAFGPGQHAEAHEHIAKHAHMPMPKSTVKKSTEAGERAKEEGDEEEKMAAAD